MSEEAMNEVFGEPEIVEEVIEEVVEKVVEEVVEPVAIPESGHLNKEQWEAAGNDPDRWVGEDVYKDRRSNTNKIDKLKTQVSDMQNEMNTRLEQQRVFMEVQNKQKIDELTAKRDDAVATANIEEFNKIQSQIDSVPVAAPQQPVTPQLDPSVDQWNQDNPWIVGNSAKAVYARNQYNTYAQQADAYGNHAHTQASALNAMKTDLKDQFPDVNPNIAGAPQVEGGSRAGKKSIKKAYSIKSVTSEEMKLREFFGDMSDTDFARTVIDSRGES